MRFDKTNMVWTRGFFLIWQGQLVSTLGDAAYSIALGFWVLHVTGSTALMGTLMAASTLPGVLVSPFAGVWIDRLNRKPLLIFMDLLRGLCMVLIAIAAFTNIIAVWMVFAAGILLSICGAFFTPGVNSVVPDLISKSKLTNANSMLKIATNGSIMLGTAVGGFVYQIIGAPMMFLFNGLSFFFSGSSLGFVKIPRAKNINKNNFFKDMLEGFRYIWVQKGLRCCVIIAATVNFFFNVAFVDFLPLFQKTPGLGSGLYGIAVACFMCGALGGYLISSFLTFLPKRRIYYFLFSNAFSCLSFIIAINQRQFIFMVPFLILGGFFNSFVNLMLFTVVQATTPNEVRGKVMAFMNMTEQCLVPFAMAAGGVLASFISIRLIISVCFLIILILITPFKFVKEFCSFINYEITNESVKKLL